VDQGCALARQRCEVLWTTAVRWRANTVTNATFELLSYGAWGHGGGSRTVVHINVGGWGS
jgi:hypothetical protein